MPQRDDEFVTYALSRSTVIKGTALRLCAGHVADAEDLAQETLVRAYVSWRRVNDPDARDAYVRRIMVRLASKYSQRGRRESPSPPPRETAEEGAYDGMGSVDDSLFIWPFLESLSPRQRAVIVLRYYQDLSEQEIADALGCTPGTVKVHASRALARLRVDLHDTEVKRNAQ